MSHQAKSRSNSSKHKHDWVLKRTKVERHEDGKNYRYKFYVCNAPGCPKPDKLTIRRIR